MRFAVLGPLAVLQDDHEPTTVRGAKERLLLAVLTAAAPGTVSTDRLLESLWDGEPPVTGRKSLQAHVVRLRSALEPDRPKGSSGRYVVRRGPGYALAVERAAVDALELADLTTRGRTRLAAGDAAGALQQLTAAVALWRGEPYADWPDAQFADVERRRLTEVHAAAVEGLLEARLALGRTAEVVPELERLVAEEPLRETWWSLLMLALYRSGRQADALAAGRRARALLADELGADPGPGLRAVEDGDPDPGPVAGPTPAANHRAAARRGRRGTSCVDPEPCRGVPVEGSRGVPEGGRCDLPRPAATGVRAGPASGRLPAARGLRPERRREVLCRAGRPRAGACRRRPAG